jgi:uncharacterized protein
VTGSLMVLSHYQAAPILAARAAGHSTARVSLDLGISEQAVDLSEEGIRLPDGQHLGWEQVEAIPAIETGCFVVRDGALERVQFYSEALDRFYSLYPTSRAPTMMVSGIPMHRIKEIDPHEDTLRKIRSVAPVTGRVLDTTTGLGYTAIEASRTASQVTTIELDPTVLEVARRNPWSQELFTRSNICQLIGDAFEVVETLEAASFSRIFHDPPTLQLAGELYSGAFYRQLYRVLQSGGRLFHYIGDLESRHGSTVAKGSVKRLQEAGFRRVDRHSETFGLVAWK